VRLVEEEVSHAMELVEVRATVLGHLVRGGNPSYQDRMVAGRFGVAALEALSTGATDEMVAWLPQQVEPGIETSDPAIQRFSLQRVLDETGRCSTGRARSPAGASGCWNRSKVRSASELSNACRRRPQSAPAPRRHRSGRWHRARARTRHR